MKLFLSFILGLLFVLLACGKKGSAPASPFDNKLKVMLDTRILSQAEYNGVTITVLWYPIHYSSLATNLGGREVLTLVSPTGNSRFADILSV